MINKQIRCQQTALYLLLLLAGNAASKQLQMQNEIAASARRNEWRTEAPSHI